MDSTEHAFAVRRIRMAIRRQLAADTERLRVMKRELESLERHLAEERCRLEALTGETK